jgi:membrane-associated protein
MNLETILSWVLHLDKHLNELVSSVGPTWVYVVLFAIIFCETGLVVLPFLPGDSLLFAVGAMCAIEGTELSLTIMIPLLIVAAVLGDAINYWIGAMVGPRVFKSESSRWLNVKHLERAQEFYEKYGSKTIIIARFVPIVRTFAPFVAGIGKMNFLRFWLYNIVGGVVWVTAFLVAGYWFGNLEIVKKNFSFVTLGIIALSVVPIALEWNSARKKAAREKSQVA